MDRKELVLAAMSTADGRAFQPVQIQKLLFLVDANVADKVGGKTFNFRPYDYGPFDGDVYYTVEMLADDGLASINRGNGWARRTYSLNEDGQIAGERILASLPVGVADYIRKASEAVRRLSFSQLVSAIYKRYPEMKANSVFSE